MIFVVPLQADLELRKPKAKYVKCRECEKMIFQEEFIEHLLEHDAYIFISICVYFFSMTYFICIRWKDVLDVQSDSSEN